MDTWIWFSFLAVIVLLLALDLGVFNRKAHVVSTREALAWSAFWIALALLFNVFIYFAYGSGSLARLLDTPGGDGKSAAITFFTAYVLEKSLSLDNIFIIALIFSYFKVPAQFQHRVLFWGVFGALVLRGAMIALGIAAIREFSWLMYVFGALLLLTAVKMLVSSEGDIDPSRSWVVRAIRRWFPVTTEFHGSKFFVRIDGVLTATPLALTLALVESADVLFAVDSIPAVFSVTLDPFLVFTSNVFAILGLRSLYFALAALMDRFEYIKFSLVFVLAFVGVKMLLSNHWHIPAWVSLTFILGMLVVGLLSSLFRHPGYSHSPLASELEQMNAMSESRVTRVFAILASTTLVLMLAGFLLFRSAPGAVFAAGVTLMSIEFVVAKRWLSRLRALG